LSKDIKLTKKQNLDLNILIIFIEKEILDLKVLTIENFFKFDI